MNQSHGSSAWKNFPMASLSKPNKKKLSQANWPRKINVFFFEFYNFTIGYHTYPVRKNLMTFGGYFVPVSESFGSKQKRSKMSRDRCANLKIIIFFKPTKIRIQIPFGQFHALSRVAFSFPSPCRWPHLEVYCQAILVIWSDFPGKLRELFLEKNHPILGETHSRLLLL